MPVRRHEPVVLLPRANKYATRHDYGIEDSLNRADYLSNAVLEDTYEAANRSRGKDHALLRNVNAAIVSTEQHVNPRSSVVSRRVRASTAPPAPRPVPGQHVQLQQNIQVAAPLLARQSPVKGPVLIMLAPSSSRSRRNINSNIPASKPVVLSQAEAPWYLRARGGSVPPPEPRFARATSLPPRPRMAQPVYRPPEPLPTAKLWAHRPMPLRSDVLRHARARSVEPTSSAGYYSEPVAYPAQIPSTVLWAHRPKPLRKDAVRLARARADDRQRRAASLPRNFDRASDYYYSIPDVKERAYNRYLYAHRGRFGLESKPPRPSLGNFPQVYVPWKGPGPSNRSKAAIIGSRLEGADAGRKQRRPRSEFAANKLREMKREEIERKYK